jgi:hypothetical protein
MGRRQAVLFAKNHSLISLHYVWEFSLIQFVADFCGVLRPGKTGITADSRWHYAHPKVTT